MSKIRHPIEAEDFAPRNLVSNIMGSDAMLEFFLKCGLSCDDIGRARSKLEEDIYDALLKAKEYGRREAKQ